MLPAQTIRLARQRLREALSPLYGERESTIIADWVLEFDSGRTREYCRMHPEEILDTSSCARLNIHLDELLRWRPVQYVLGEAWFMGMRFHVDERVLIPRPETEELVEWVTASARTREQDKSGQLQILDIGTGSGCIPIALKSALPQASVWSLDTSEGALEVARENARTLHADIHFLHMNILDVHAESAMPVVDIIVSNPPYVLDDDRGEMRPNVIDWEPHLALFVEGQDPLLFYHRIADLGLVKLSAGGLVFLEIQETKAEAVAGLFQSRGYVDIEVRPDLSGRDRMVRARKA